MFKPMFFYGTLTDPDILAAVLDRPVSAGEAVPAILKGWARVPVAGRPYPMLVREAPARVEGLLMRRPSDRDRLRLDRYEGPEYRVENLEVATADGIVTAAVYLCRPGIRPGPGSWDMEAWRRRHKRAALAHVRGGSAGPVKD